MKISRRKFISVGAGAVLGSSQLLLAAANATSVSSRGTNPSRTLVIVQLAGGNDGLNTIIPYGSKHYYQARPNLAIKANDILPLTDLIGMHPSMSALSELYPAGTLAIALG